MEKEAIILEDELECKYEKLNVTCANIAETSNSFMEEQSKNIILENSYLELQNKFCNLEQETEKQSNILKECMEKNKITTKIENKNQQC